MVKSIEIGYCLNSKYWNKGYITETLKGAIDYISQNKLTHRVIAYHAVDNPASGKVMQKAGMQHEGTLRKAARNNSNYFCDVHIYAILLGEFA